MSELTLQSINKSIILLFILTGQLIYAQDSVENAAAEMAKKMQDPLGNISAVMSDNDLMFKTGNDDFSFSSSIQPVQAWSFEDAGFNFIARGVIPILGLAPEAQKPIVGEPLPKGGSATWGLSDIILQFYFSPKGDGAWKWGLGPMVSLRTRTNSKLAGAGWGAGPVGVLVGGAGNFSFAFIGGQLWNFDNTFSTTIFQPMIYYNIPNSPGLALNYNIQWSYNWKASSGNELTLPLGLSINKTLSVFNGNGLDLGIGIYWNVARPEGAASSLLRINLAWIFP